MLSPPAHPRIAHHLDFPDYSAGELGEIAELMLSDLSYQLSDSAKKVLNDYIPLRMKLPHFANARSIRNALDRARLRQANRLFASKNQSLTKSDLTTLDDEDFLASRVFSEGQLDGDPVDGILNPISMDQPE